MAPAKVRISPKAVRTVGSMTPVGGTMKAAMRRCTPKNTKAMAVKSWSLVCMVRDGQRANVKVGLNAESTVGGRDAAATASSAFSEVT